MKGEISCVVCYKLDRCSRSILDFTQLINLFQQQAVDFISCTEKFDTATPMGRAMLNICVVFAQLERETIQQRITDAYHSRCKKGYFMGGRIPFGFSLTSCIIDRKKTSCYEVKENEAEIMRRIYSIYQKKSASLADVVLTLTEAHIQNPRRNDGLWIRPHISRMIKNPIYVRADTKIYDYFQQLNTILDNPKEDYIGHNGCYLYNIGNEQHLVLAPHEGLVSSDIWLKCQNRSVVQNKNSRPKSWLIGSLKCKKCGRAIVMRQTTGRNGQIYRYLRCSGALGKSRLCTGFKAYPAEKVESAIADAIIAHLKFLAAPESPAENDTSHVKNTLLQLASTYDGTENSLFSIQKTLQNLHSQITHAENNSTRQEGWNQIIQNLTRWDSLEPNTQAKIATLMISRIEMTDSMITIHWSF